MIGKEHEVIVDGLVVGKTRFPWLFSNFGGYKGWRRLLQDKLWESGHRDIYVLGRLFKHLIILDVDRDECWLIPKFEESGFSIRIGWLYWAVAISKEPWYPRLPKDSKIPGGNHDWNDYVYV